MDLLFCSKQMAASAGLYEKKKNWCCGYMIFNGFLLQIFNCIATIPCCITAHATLVVVPIIMSKCICIYIHMYVHQEGVSLWKTYAGT